MRSTTSRTLALLRKEGWVCQLVEVWNPYSRKRQDLFGWFDVLAFRRPGDGILGIQSTTGANAGARLRKAELLPGLAGWLAAGGRAELWSWAKRGPRGKRKVWTVIRRPLRLPLYSTVLAGQIGMPFVVEDAGASEASEST